MKFATKAVHAGQQPDPATGAIMPPVYLTSTYVQAAPGEHKGYDYSRAGNPTRTALEGNLAALENARFGTAFSSGVAAMDGILKNLRPGDHVVSSNDLYGGSYRLMMRVYEKFGIAFSFVDMSDPANVAQALRPETKLLWIETPTNPLLNVVDIAAMAGMVQGRDVTVAVDNTFASPFLQQPLDLGAHLVLHSTTKYLGGHSDVIGGAVCTNDEQWHEALQFQVKASGASPGPMDCFLVLRGTKTLHLRMERHCHNARRVAEFLRDHPNVGHVRYPGFENHPGHAVAKKQMRDFGGMVSFTLKDDSIEKAMRVLGGTQVFSLAESLGGVESLIGHPATMTHASIPAEDRQRAGLSDSLIRLSIGIEDADDLVADLDRALAAV